jgi:hypothetical protein
MLPSRSPPNPRMQPRDGEAPASARSMPSGSATRKHRIVRARVLIARS